MHSVKYVREERVYLKNGSHIYPFIWIEFFEDAFLSLGFMSKQIKLTEYGSAIQRGLQFREHIEVIKRGTITIKEKNATF